MNMNIAAKKQKAIFLTVFAIYILSLLYLTIFRFNFYYDERRLNLTLFIGLINVFRNAGIGEFLRQFLGNIGWFVPLGFFLPVLIKRKSLLITAAIGLAFSFFIEVTQFVFYKGVAELDDLILNTLGAVIGYLLYRLSKKLF